MHISSYLCKKNILYNLEADSKEEVLKRLAEKASSLINEASFEEIFRVLSEREELGSTAIGGGIAIPHAKVEGLKKIFIVVAVSSKGVPFEALDGEDVYVIFTLLAPEDATIEYLKVLANVSRLLKKGQLISHLKEAKGEEEIIEIIKETEFNRIAR